MVAKETVIENHIERKSCRLCILKHTKKQPEMKAIDSGEKNEQKVT